MLARRLLLGRAAPRLFSPCSLLAPRLPAVASVALPPLLLQQERAYRHVKGRGAVQVGDGKNRMKKAATRDANEPGVYPGQIFASHGKLVDVALKDGRDVRCKAAGRLAKERVRLRVGDEVLVKFLLDIDEDAQTPSIVAKQVSSSTNNQDAARR